MTSSKPNPGRPLLVPSYRAWSSIGIWGRADTHSQEQPGSGESRGQGSERPGLREQSGAPEVGQL